MSDPGNLAEMFALPPHLAALQLLVNRCPDAVSRKALIVCAGSCEAIGRDEGFVMVTANQLETA
ncbi:hypothetical protein [Sphingomonas sp. PAMC 26617]|uniref:hypothetical protein n=1 Tax=Sphingomonas sp. PAMC 26617 TaxID=1112216 RepID=UPI0004980E6D|nr:hypothetical protein [Sphingomonas sp. PAMC 26617]